MGLHTKAALARMQEGSKRGLTLAAEHLLGVSRDLVPIEEGDLQRTGRTSVKGHSHATVTYGGQGLQDYAVRQHEELTWRHDPGRQAKYLEEPFYGEAATMKAIIAEAMRRSIK